LTPALFHRQSSIPGGHDGSDRGSVIRGVVADDDRNSAFSREDFRHLGANALCAASNEDDVVAQTEVHD
jgi:hypothetical protein